jgi:hypothetical protein
VQLRFLGLNMLLAESECAVISAGVLISVVSPFSALDGTE